MWSNRWPLWGKEAVCVTQNFTPSFKGNSRKEERARELTLPLLKWLNLASWQTLDYGRNKSECGSGGPPSKWYHPLTQHSSGGWPLEVCTMNVTNHKFVQVLWNLVKPNLCGSLHKSTRIYMSHHEGLVGECKLPGKHNSPYESVRQPNPPCGSAPLLSFQSHHHHRSHPNPRRQQATPSCIGRQ